MANNDIQQLVNKISQADRTVISEFFKKGGYPSECSGLFPKEYKRTDGVRYSFNKRNNTAFTTQDIFQALGGDYDIMKSPTAKGYIEELKQFQKKHGSIDRLITFDNDLYKRINDFTTYNKIGLGNFIRAVGFEYNTETRQATKDEHISALKSIELEHGSLEHLQAIDRELYGKLSSLASYRGISVNEYIISLGFKYQEKIEYTDKDIKKRLDELKDESGTVNGLFQLDKGFYEMLHTRAQRKSITLGEYIATFGVIYEGELNREQLVAELSKHQKDGLIDLEKLPPKLQSCLTSWASRDNTTMQDFLLANSTYRLAGEQKILGSYVEQTQAMFDEVFRPNGETHEIDLSNVGLPKNYTKLYCRIQHMRTAMSDDTVETIEDTIHNHLRGYVYLGRRTTLSHMNENDLIEGLKDYFEGRREVSQAEKKKYLREAQSYAASKGISTRELYQSYGVIVKQAKGKSNAMKRIKVNLGEDGSL